MPYVYAVVFDSNVVKFGRSIDPWKRIYNHVSEGRRYEQQAVMAFLSQVSDAVKAESDILIQASWELDEVSQESFRFRSLSSVASCFHACRLEFMAFRVSDRPYRLTVSDDTFKFDPEAFTKKEAGKDPLILVKRGIARAVSGKEFATMTDVKMGNKGKRVGDLKSVILKMEESGHIRIVRRKDPFYGVESNDLDKAKFYHTDKTVEYLG